MNQIRLFVTGGTFDKEYDELTGRLFFRDTHVSEMLRLGRCGLAVEIQTLLMMDSLDMMDQDRALILTNCQNCPEDRILITHGTDTMEQTARVLGSAHVAGNLRKTVVLTGAMIPYAFGSSDGLFNLGAALAFTQTLSNGVYVAMNGQVFHWNNVQKDKLTGRFKERST